MIGLGRGRYGESVGEAEPQRMMPTGDNAALSPLGGNGMTGEGTNGDRHSIYRCISGL